MEPEAQAAVWMKSRAAVWSQWIAQSQSPSRQLTVEQAHHRVERYRAIARDLTIARKLAPRSAATTALESLYRSSHLRIDAAARHSVSSLLRLFGDEIPEVIATLRPTILWLALLMLVGALTGGWLISTYPDLISLIASQEMINKVQHGELWTDNLLSVTPPALLSVTILSNNIFVSITAFCAGVLFGLGAFYIVAFNGLMLGAMFAFTHQYGMDGALLRFVSAHGLVELSVICVAGAAGVALGESLIRPTLPTRLESFQFAASRVGRVLLACAILLIGCGLIEGFISPNPGVPFLSRIVIGICWWVLMLLFLSGRLFRQRQAKSVVADASSNTHSIPPGPIAQV
ncbi:MAG TPA: stage II sporulation protein M [Steroidobacteraceae bacterium]|jgi:uncharacterized membrane protein SpoIIM required for sporulation|nr:stage II sporulation protein M [Steroidobacteraceae bacterium]